MPTPSGIAKEETLSRRFGVGENVITWANNGVPLVASASISPSAPDKAIRLLWLQALPRVDNTQGNLIVVRWDDAGATEPLYCSETISHYQPKEAPEAGMDLLIIVENSQPVPVTAHYEEFTP